MTGILKEKVYLLRKAFKTCFMLSNQPKIAKILLKTPSENEFQFWEYARVAELWKNVGGGCLWATKILNASTQQLDRWLRQE